MPDDHDPKNTFVLAHLTDLHIACTAGIRIRQILNKRLFGYLGWKLHRGTAHSAALLATLAHNLALTRPHHIAVTGDLTHLGLPAEFKKSRQWLQSVGYPDRVTVVPGNHDAYVGTAWSQSFACWSDYMLSDNEGSKSGPADSFDGIFPCLRIRGQIALIGVCTARPSAPLLAVGSIGSRQMQKLETILARTAKQHLFRVLLIHHPPTAGAVAWRKRLTDAAALRSLLHRCGVELILHGHAHHTGQRVIKTPSGFAPVVGAPSITSLARARARRAGYGLYRITPKAGKWDIRVAVHVYSQDERRFVLEHEQRFDLDGTA